MRGLIAALYLVAVGWAISHYELDKLWAEAAHKALRHLMRESAQISLEVQQQAALPSAWQYASASGLSGIIWVPAVLPDGGDSDG